CSPTPLCHSHAFPTRRSSDLRMTGPMDYFNFQRLIATCAFVITDSGGIQEETTFRQVPCLTLRPNTERPVTVDLGSNRLIGFDLDRKSTRLNSSHVKISYAVF